MKKYKVKWKGKCALLTAVTLAVGSINIPVSVAGASVQSNQ